MPPVASPTGEIAALLREEIAGVERFVRLLQSEQSFLQSAATDELSMASAEKSVLAEHLAKLAKVRNERLGQSGFGLDREGLQAWAAASGHDAAELQQRLLALAAEARELNRVNGQLIALRLSTTQAALAALTPENRRNPLYGRNGQTSPLTGYRIIDSA